MKDRIPENHGREDVVQEYAALQRLTEIAQFAQKRLFSDQQRLEASIVGLNESIVGANEHGLDIGQTRGVLARIEFSYKNSFLTSLLKKYTDKMVEMKAEEPVLEAEKAEVS